jgi:hypothetical protein
MHIEVRIEINIRARAERTAPNVDADTEGETGRED